MLVAIQHSIQSYTTVFFLKMTFQGDKKVQLDLFPGVPVIDIYSFWAACDKQTISFLYHWK